MKHSATTHPNMPDNKERLIEIATRPFSDNAEMKLAAARLLDELVKPDVDGAEHAIARWEAVDGKKRLPKWRIMLFSLLLIVSATIFTLGVPEANSLREISHAISTLGGATVRLGPDPLLRKAGKISLNDTERLILYGDETQTSKAGMAKGLWDRFPDNPAYFGQYAGAYLSENGKLPADFLEQARRLDPQNSWFLYLAAGVEGKDSVKKKIQSASAKAAKEAPEWEILDQARLENALRLVREARELNLCNDYKSDLMREKIPLMAQGDKLERLISIGHLAGMTASDLIAMRKISDVIAAKARLLGKENNIGEFRELMADSDAFGRKMLSAEPSTLVAGLVNGVNVSGVSQGLAAGARDLGLNSEAERFQSLHDRWRQSRESQKKKELRVDGVEFAKKAAFLPALSLPMVWQQAVGPPAITDEDLKAGRLVEHETASMVFAVGVFFLIGFCMAAVWISNFLRRPVIRRLASRIESLLLPVDWMWLMGLGLFVPFLFVMSINRFTSLGGRDFSVFGMKLFLPFGHFFTMALLMVIVPVLVTRWRISKRVPFLKSGWGKSWVGWIAVISAMAYVVAIGYLVVSDSLDRVRVVTAFLLFLPKIWLLAIAVRALIAGPARSLMSCTVARVLVPVYATAMLLMISMAPIFKAAETYWFEHDAFMSLDAKFPGMGTYEYKVAVQLQKGLREALGYEAP